MKGRTKAESGRAEQPEELTGGERKLCHDDLYNSYITKLVTIIILSRKIRWVGHVARMGQNRNS